MSWEIKPAREAFPAIAAEWDRLNAELYGGHPMFDSRFVGPLLECFGEGGERLCLHRTAGRIDGALILKPSGWGRWTLFQPSQAQLGTLVLKDARLLETLFAPLPGFVWSIELLALDPEYTPNWGGFQLPRIVAAHALTMAAETTDGFDAYWQARPNQLKKNLRRYRRRSDEQHAGRQFAFITQPEQIAAAVTRYGELESAGWKGTAGTAVNAKNMQGRFYATVLREFAATGQASVPELHIGDKLAASRLIVRNDRMAVILKTTYDEALADIAPGRQHLYETLQAAAAEPLTRTVEFYTNVTRDQTDWATSLRYICHHHLFRNKLVAGVYQLINALRPGRRPVVPEDKIKFPVAETVSQLSTETLPPATAKLFASAEISSFDASADWFSNLQQTVFFDDQGVRFYFGLFKDRPRAILPLRLVAKGRGREIQSLGHFYTSLYTPVLDANATEIDLATVLEQAGRDCGNAHVMRFAPLDRESPKYETLLTALRSVGWIPFRFYCFGNWFLRVDSDWQDYLARRDGQLRGLLRRKGKKFAAAGGSMEIVTDSIAAESAIRDYSAVYAKSWKKPEPYPQFIPGLIRWLAAKGWLRLGIARFAGQPVAAQIWIVAHGKACIFKLAYDAAFAHLAPGTLLTAHLMQHAIDIDRVREVDYLIGDDPYKVDWMSHRRERWGIVAYNPRTATGLAFLLKETLGHIRSKLFRGPTVRPGK